MRKDYLTMQECADAFGISRHVMRTYVATKPGFPVVQVGSVHIVPKARLQVWLDSPEGREYLERRARYRKHKPWVEIK